MRVRIYNIEDHDILERYFGEDAGEYPVSNIGELHGEQLFNGSMSAIPTEGDPVILPNLDDDRQSEYVCIMRAFYPVLDEIDLIVTKRTFKEALSS